MSRHDIERIQSANVGVLRLYTSSGRGFIHILTITYPIDEANSESVREQAGPIAK
jgi:hypothetical protein